MRLDRPLDDLFQSPSHSRVLRALFELPEGFATSARDLARRAGVSHPTASKVLASLAEQGVVTARRSPRADRFELDRRHIAFEELARLIEWERGLPAQLIALLRKQIRSRAPSVREAFIFGSAARGEMEASSDIDLAVTCAKKDQGRVEAALQAVADEVLARFGNRLSTIVATGSLESLSHANGSGKQRLWRQVRREGIPILVGRGSR